MYVVVVVVVVVVTQFEPRSRCRSRAKPGVHGNITAVKHDGVAGSQPGHAQAGGLEPT